MIKHVQFKIAVREGQSVIEVDTNTESLDIPVGKLLPQGREGAVLAAKILKERGLLPSTVDAESLVYK